MLQQNGNWVEKVGDVKILCTVVKLGADPSSQAVVCSRLPAGIAKSNPAAGMTVLAVRWKSLQHFHFYLAGARKKAACRILGAETSEGVTEKLVELKRY
jgi:hypothetical protein